MYDFYRHEFPLSVAELIGFSVITQHIDDEHKYEEYFENQCHRFHVFDE